MGLGKTLEVLACILLNPRNCSGVQNGVCICLFFSLLKNFSIFLIHMKFNIFFPFLYHLFTIPYYEPIKMFSSFFKNFFLHWCNIKNWFCRCTFITVNFTYHYFITMSCLWSKVSLETCGSGFITDQVQIFLRIFLSNCFLRIYKVYIKA